MQLRHYALVFFHSLWVIVIGTALCAGLTYELSHLVKPVYTSSAMIQVNTLSPLANDSVYGNQALAVSYAVLVTDADVLQNAAQSLPGISASQIGSSVSVAPVDSTEIIEVQAKANDPQIAANIANAVVNSFIQIQDAKDSARFKTMGTSVAQDLLTAKANVAKAQADLTLLQNTGAPQGKIISQQSLLDGDQTNYNALLASYQQIEEQQIQVSNTLVEIQTATPPSVSTSPKILTNTLIAASLGFLLMLTLVLVLDWLNTTIKTPEDVANLAGLISLGSIPATKNPLLYRADRSVPDDSIEQAAIIISTNFKISRKSQVVLVTGSRPGVGTTTSAANLAVALAQAGKHVLLVDANFFRPALHTIFPSSGNSGWVQSFSDPRMLSSTMTSDTLLKQWRTEIPNLWFLPLGSLPTHYSVVTLASQLETFITGLFQQSKGLGQGHIDTVIIDAPSLRDGATTVALASIASGSTLVVKAGAEHARMLSDASAKLAVLNAPLLGVIVNRQSPKHRPYFYIDNYRPNTVLAINSLETDNLDYVKVPPIVSQPLPIVDKVDVEAVDVQDTMPSWPGVLSSQQAQAVTNDGRGSAGPATNPPSWSGVSPNPQQPMTRSAGQTANPPSWSGVSPNPQQPMMRPAGPAGPATNPPSWSGVSPNPQQQQPATNDGEVPSGPLPNQKRNRLARLS